ncbi:PIR Superfamily Protein [Plasmodium ovale curtisi]|uniref:PIR Superfamily Protein n=1 Tax=Plasmodium ovale curtisi TaxID=864141 RepID=A0A1A8WHB6_PLAOA|nr:PIR Superfamily Protein [Plasmodium ovale curtisi]
MSIKTKDSKEICEEPDVHESGILGIKVSGNDSIPYITIKADGRIDVSDTSKKEDDISTFPIHRIGIIVVLFTPFGSMLCNEISGKKKISDRLRKDYEQEFLSDAEKSMYRNSKNNRIRIAYNAE